MSAALEARYRAALRWYPRSWRAVNADAIVGTMLDQAEADGRDAPLPGELRDLAGSAVRARLAGLNAFYPRSVRDRVALIALLLGVALSVLSVVLTEWAPFAPREPVTYGDGSMFIPAVARFGPFLSAGVLIYLAWILAFGAVLLRQRALAVALLGLTIPLSVVLYLSRPEPWAANQGSPITHLTLGGLAVLVMLGSARRPVSLVRIGLGLAAAVLVIVAGTQYVSGSYQYQYRLFVYFEPRLILTALLLLAIVAAVRQSRAWSAALVLMALPWLVMSMLYLVPVVFVAGTAAALVVLVVAFAIWRARRGGSSNAPSSRSS